MAIRVVLMTDFSESYANKLIKGMAEYSFKYSPLVMCKMPLSVYASGGIRKVLEFSLKWKADAIIGQFNEEDDLSIFKENGIMVIAQDFRKRIPGVSNITSDYHAQGRMAAEYLIRQGARNFGFYGLSGMVWSDERKEGFISEITRQITGAEVSVEERSCTDDIWWYDLGKITEWIEALPKPVAILSCDDNMAFHIIEACNQLNDSGCRIPDDIMLLGVDDDESLCQLSSPTLSSIKPMVELAGFYTAKQIDDRLHLPAEERMDAVEDINVMLGSIVVRRSTDIFYHENPYINKVCDYIQRHYTENLKVDQLVALVPMSRRLLEKLFVGEMNVTIHQFIIRLRVEKMVSLMSQGYSPLDAANAMNMDFKALSRSFKMATGKTPTEYARAMAEGKVPSKM